MKLVQRDNKQLRVEEDRLEEMLRSGYVEVDGRTGKPVAAAEPAGDAMGRKKRLPKDIE